MNRTIAVFFLAGLLAGVVAAAEPAGGGKKTRPANVEEARAQQFAKLNDRRGIALPNPEEALANIPAYVNQLDLWGDEPWEVDRREKPDEATVFVPAGVQTLRGVLLSFAGRTTIDYREPCRAWQFLFLSPRTTREYYLFSRDGAKFLKAYLKALGQKLGHPELENLPVAWISWQGTEESGVEDWFKSDVQVLCHLHGWGVSRERLGALKTTPFLSASEAMPNSGPVRFDRDPLVLRAHSTDFRHKHGMYNKPEMYFFLIDQMIRMRLPFDADGAKGPVKLRPVSVEAGLLADSEYIRPKGGNWVEFFPEKDYQGDKSKACWLPNEDFAWAWRAWSAKTDTPVWITGPVKAYQKGTLRRNARGEGWDGGIGFGKVHKPGQTFDITVETRSDEIAKVEFYDWSKKIGESTESPFTLKQASFRQPGIHVLIAVAVMKDGARATSYPAGMVVEGDMYAK